MRMNQKRIILNQNKCNLNFYLIIKRCTAVLSILDKNKLLEEIEIFY